MSKAVVLDSHVKAAAHAIKNARDARVPIPQVSVDYGIQDVDSAYAVANFNVQAASSAGRKLSGRKIGLTSLAVQKQMGVYEPDYGVLFSDMEYLSGCELPLFRLIQPKAEGEIAFVIGRDLDTDGLSWAQFLRGIEYVLPAIEIVDSAIENWDLTLPDTIADNASSGLYVLGLEPRHLGDVDLERCVMNFARNGKTASSGSGAECLGHPLLAAHWLSRKMYQLDSPLKAGDVVLSGALGPMVSIGKGDCLEVSISGFGSVKCSVGD
ncbi:2-keto-4-pentenoate hydratase [Pusillimonas sp. DMV24BSW_D]|uniref:2-keto-4-pentenoate hydratase n=1 Tax=Neopusillimonas aestuarii TaxID=2716226 RepID=UPI001408FA5A|nr:fumarylacetoacetate hydrolase family protein [Pusillimonas sp. DMV24BSW_D]QIM47907.1 2-keto-4-pentenoate hydratase [Pusillimonas sp. DMV24BSW_D]